ncbi:MAG: hypothetical protein KAQ79_09605, partial [Cyclobacteriaceae bacterium]|nr:hypothetical protein [Cyclobacteriaceae bacterium]
SEESGKATTMKHLDLFRHLLANCNDLSYGKRTIYICQLFPSWKIDAFSSVLTAGQSMDYR